MTPAEIVALDQESVIVWPCLREERLGGWVLRFGGGVYGRSNSVQPYGDPGRPIAEAIDYCESAYRTEGLPTMFRLAHVGDWQRLDDELAARGYEIDDSTVIQVRELRADEERSGVELLEAPTEEWLAAYFAGSGRGAGREATVRALFSKVPHPRRFAMIHLDGGIVALGLGSIYRGTMWMFGVATVPEHRGRGFGRRVCQALMAWAHEEGAHRSALQVASTNVAALRLYEGLGFSHAYRYSYRRKLLS